MRVEGSYRKLVENFHPANESSYESGLRGGGRSPFTVIAYARVDVGSPRWTPVPLTVIAYAPVDEGLRRGEPTMTRNYFRNFR